MIDIYLKQINGISRKFSTDDKYEVKQIETIEDEELAYKISMNILNVEEHDHDDSYEINVANGLGMQKYFFEIDVEGVDGGGKIPGDKVLFFKIMQTIFDLLSAVCSLFLQVNTKKAAALIVVLALLAILLIIIGLFLMYKRKVVNNETAPLSNLDSRQ